VPVYPGCPRKRLLNGCSYKNCRLSNITPFEDVGAQQLLELLYEWEHAASYLNESGGCNEASIPVHKHGCDLWEMSLDQWYCEQGRDIIIIILPSVNIIPGDDKNYYYYNTVFNAPCVGRLNDKIAGAAIQMMDDSECDISRVNVPKVKMSTLQWSPSVDIYLWAVVFSAVALSVLWWHLVNTVTSLHFAWVVDYEKCVVATCICVCVCLSVCLSSAACPHYCTDRDVTWGSGRGCPLAVHYWADLQSVQGLHCYGNTMEMHGGAER